jgi:hypothetical protein
MLRLYKNLRIELQTLSKVYSDRENSLIGLVSIAEHLIQIRDLLNHSGKLIIKMVTNDLPASHLLYKEKL